MKLLVRNKVENADHWKRIFDEQDDAARASGMSVVGVWRSVDDPSQVYFVLDVEDRARAEAYMAAPEASEVGRKAGVIDGEAHFVESFDA